MADSAASPGRKNAADGGGKLLAAWLTALQAELMLGHLAVAGAAWPQSNLYCHACITAVRSVTLMMQKALRHEAGFEDWYRDVQEHLAADAEFVFLKKARNYVLHEGALQLMMSHRLTYTGTAGIQVKGIGPNGPDVCVHDRDSGAMVPADWRRLEGFKFETPVRFGPVKGLPEPPDRELVEMLEEKIAKLRLILHEADVRFDPEHAEPEVAEADERELGAPWREQPKTS